MCMFQLQDQFQRGKKRYAMAREIVSDLYSHSNPNFDSGSSLVIDGINQVGLLSGSMSPTNYS